MVELIEAIVKENLGVMSLVLGNLGWSLRSRTESCEEPAKDNGWLPMYHHSNFYGLTIDGPGIVIAGLLWIIHLFLVQALQINYVIYLSLYALGLSLPWLMRVLLVWPIHSLFPFLFRNKEIKCSPAVMATEEESGSSDELTFGYTGDRKN